MGGCSVLAGLPVSVPGRPKPAALRKLLHAAGSVASQCAWNSKLAAQGNLLYAPGCLAPGLCAWTAWFSPSQTPEEGCSMSLAVWTGAGSCK